MIEYRNILIPYDFSEHSEEALRIACDFGTRLGSALHVVHVVQHPVHVAITPGAGIGVQAPVAPDWEGVRAGAAEALQSAIRPSATRFEGEVHLHTVTGSTVVDALVQKADEIGADLIVMGTHGRTGFAHVFLGSVAERTLRRASCPVVTVRGPEDGGAVNE